MPIDEQREADAVLAGLGAGFICICRESYFPEDRPVGRDWRYGSCNWRKHAVSVSYNSARPWKVFCECGAIWTRTTWMGNEWALSRPDIHSYDL